MPNLADTVADGHAEVDEHAEDLGEAFANRLRDLLDNPDQRIPEIWREAGISETVTFNEAMSAGRTDFKALSVAGAIYAAARVQAFTEIIGRQVLQAAADNIQRILGQTKKMDRADLQNQVKQGTKKAHFKAAKERRKTNGTEKLDT